jgi:hypothetical protein
MLRAASDAPAPVETKPSLNNRRAPAGLEQPAELEDVPTAIEELPRDEPREMWPLEEYADQANSDPNSDPSEESSSPPPSVWSKYRLFGLRHSSTHGRNVGMGVPLVGTSWRNRPYYIGADIGTLWVTQPPNDNVTRDTDMFGGVFAGWDWDHYWGTELGVRRATPELKNVEARDADRGDALMVWSASLMYYPWGDSLYRPYWRCGLAAMHIDYPTDDGDRRDEDLWTIPVGLGIKYPLRRWLAARAEFTDQLGIGNNTVAAQHNLTLTFGLEWRYGAHPRSYWPWNPSTQIW